MATIRELEIIKSALECDIAHQDAYLIELQKKRINYPLEVDTDKYNLFYDWLEDSKVLHNKVSKRLSKELSEENRIKLLEDTIKKLEKLIK